MEPELTEIRYVYIYSNKMQTFHFPVINKDNSVLLKISPVLLKITT